MTNRSLLSLFITAILVGIIVGVLIVSMFQFNEPVGPTYVPAFDPQSWFRGEVPMTLSPAQT